MIKDFKSWAEDNGKLDEGMLGNLWQGIKKAAGAYAGGAQAGLNAIQNINQPINYAVNVLGQLRQKMAANSELANQILANHPKAREAHNQAIDTIGKAFEQMSQAQTHFAKAGQDIQKQAQQQQDEPENVEATPVDNQQGQPQQGQPQQGQPQQGQPQQGQPQQGQQPAPPGGHTIASAGP